MDETTQMRIGRRLRARREQVGMSQEALSRELGFRNRQTLGTIELGERPIQANELAAAAQALAVDVHYFTDPFIAAGEAAFSFRSASVPAADIADFERRAGDWLATYHVLAKPSLLKKSLSLNVTSSFEQARNAAEQTRRDLTLGSYPAHELQEALETKWQILVLFVDLPEGVSGAASRLEGVQAILVNRNESAGRRAYNLAHELFHLLTWDAMPPERIDAESAAKRKRVEQLANNFASALLMPSETLRQAWESRKRLGVPERIAATSVLFGVSAPALKWRVHALGLLKANELPDDTQLVTSKAGTGRNETRPPLFNVEFVRRIHTAVEEGTLSLRKAAGIVGTDSAGLAELCRTYGRQLSYDT